jgi:hypothetical protein
MTPRMLQGTPFSTKPDEKPSLGKKPNVKPKRKHSNNEIRYYRKRTGKRNTKNAMRTKKNWT